MAHMFVLYSAQHANNYIETDVAVCSMDPEYLLFISYEMCFLCAV